MVMLMYRSACSDEVTCKHLKDHTDTHTHTQELAVFSAQTRMEACEACVERLGWNPKFAVKTQWRVCTRHLSSGLWRVVLVRGCIHHYGQTMMGGEGAVTV